MTSSSCEMTYGVVNYHCKINKMVFRGNLSAETRAYMAYLLRYKRLPVADIAARCQVSRATVYRYKNIGHAAIHRESRNGGRPRKISERDGRTIIRALHQLRREEGNFNSKRLMTKADIDGKKISNRTVRRFLRRKGYFFLQARKKGLLTSMDLRKRRKFARHMKDYFRSDVWTRTVAFYLDGVSFYFKTNPLSQARSPRGRIWRKKSEGLQQGCTAKGHKEGSGGKVVKLFVAISYGQGVIECEQYEKLDGRYFEGFVRRKFPAMFKRANKGTSKMFIQDNDPSQNCASVQNALKEMGSELLSIPARSPDINPIENVFHLVKKQLHMQALQNNISKEIYEEFCIRVINTITQFSSEQIDKIIDTLDHRMDLIIKNNGNRIKY